MSSKEAQAIYELNQLSVSQKDGVVRKGDGTVVGSQKWLINVDSVSYTHLTLPTKA